MIRSNSPNFAADQVSGRVSPFTGRHVYVSILAGVQTTRNPPPGIRFDALSTKGPAPGSADARLMKILLADAFEQSGVDALSEAGHDLDHQPTLTSTQLAAALGDAEVLVVRSTRVEADVFDVDGPLGLVIRAGAGTNTIDSKAAARRAVCRQRSGQERGGCGRITMVSCSRSTGGSRQRRRSRRGPGTRRPTPKLKACWQGDGIAVSARSVWRWTSERAAFGMRVDHH